MISLNSFKCYLKLLFSSIFKLNNFLIKFTLFITKDCLYKLVKTTMRNDTVFLFFILIAINSDKVNLIAPNALQSNKFHSFSSIASSFSPNGGISLFSINNPLSTSSRTWNSYHQISLFYMNHSLIPLLLLK